MADYGFKTEPFSHQRDAYNATRDERAHAVYWEQGCGKSKLAIDTAAHQFGRSKDAVGHMLVIAPGGVHRNWTVDELPTHCPAPWRGMTFYTSRASTKRQGAAVDKLLNERGDHLRVLTLTYDALCTDAGAAAAKRMLVERPCMLILDEAHRVKNPSALRTRRALYAASLAKSVRSMTGTPIANAPEDVYAQIRMLEETFWIKHGLDSLASFRNRFCVFGQIKQRVPTRSGVTRERIIKTVRGYRDLEALHRMIAPISSRVLKDDVLDLPPKLYSKRYFEMTPRQAEIYKRLRDDYWAELESGERVIATLAMVRMLRLAQVASNYIPGDDDKPAVPIDDDNNPRLAALLDELEDVDGQAIIWARFTHDVDLICKALGAEAVRYDGEVKERDREIALDRFKRGEARHIVGKAASMGTGLTLVGAATTLYYNNSFVLTDRLQSEDRNHRIGQLKPVRYVDFIAEGTVDEKTVDALRRKRDVASAVMGDGLREWI